MSARAWFWILPIMCPAPLAILLSCHSHEPPVASPISPVPPTPAEVRFTEAVATGDQSCHDDLQCSESEKGWTVICRAPWALSDSGCPAPGCRERQLYPECGSSKSCTENMSCLPRSHTNSVGDERFDGMFCNITPCGEDGDCRSANLRCRDGSCVFRQCESSDCLGYCIDGACSANPGTCVELDPNPLPRP